MKKRILALLLTIATALSSFWLICCDAEYKGDFTTPIYSEAEKSMLISRIMQYDGLNNLALAKQMGVENYVAEFKGEAIQKKTYLGNIQFDSTYNSGNYNSYGDLTETNTSTCDAEVIIEFVPTKVGGNGQPALVQYVGLDTKEEISEYRKIRKTSGSGDSFRSWYEFGELQESTRESRGEVWASNYEISTYADSEKGTENLYWYYRSQSESVTEKSSYASSTEKNSNKTKGEAKVEINDVSSLKEALKPFLVTTKDSKKIETWDVTGVTTFKPDVIIYSDVNKFNLKYQFTHEQEDFSDSLFLSFMDDIDYDTHYSFYEVTIVFDEELGQYQCKVTLNSNFSSHYDSEQGLSYNHTTTMNYELELRTNASKHARLPLDKTEFRNTVNK